jgi:hypothetical protein
MSHSSPAVLRAADSTLFVGARHAVPSLDACPGVLACHPERSEGSAFSLNRRELFPKSRVPITRAAQRPQRFPNQVFIAQERNMNDIGGGMIGLVAVILSLGIPMAGMYTYYRIRKLKADERMAAIARGVAVPFETEVSPAARSRKNAILLISAALGFMATFGCIASIVHEPETWTAAAFGLIPLSIGLGYLLDFTLTRREAHS